MSDRTVSSDEAANERGSASAPLFILSFRQRDELAALGAHGGWNVVAARRSDGAEQRFLASGAQVAVVDARGALGDGLTAVAALGDAVAANGGALLVLVSRGDIDEIGTFYDAGATHFLASPLSEQEFVQALRFAARHCERLSGDWRQAGASPAPLGWRLDRPSGTVRLTPALSELLDTSEIDSARGLLRRLGVDDRLIALSALRRLVRSGAATAFAHDFDGIGRVVQHLQLDSQGGFVDAVVERLRPVDARVAVIGDVLSDVRDANGARRWLDRRLVDGGERAVQAMLVALNRFDIVNAAYGRSAGDGLLRAAQRRIDEVVGDLLGRAAIVARMGGSEFLVAAAEAPARFELVAGRVAESLARPFVAGGAMAVLGCRIGIAAAQIDDTSASLLRRTSEALAEARASDSLTIHVARGAADQGASIDTLAVDLRRAIDRAEIDILFQPQVSITTGVIVGVEALARWDHPVMGAIGAETLFAAADRADLVIGLSDHLQRTVLARAAAWPASLSGLRVALNLTAADIARPGFADIFLDRVDSSGFPRGRLTVEITESGLIEDLGIASMLLATLRSAGCRVAIDDFGTGYSSLAYLKALPLDYLKIDKKLAQDIAGSTRDRIVVRGVIDMARSLGLSVIAEGVETDEQLDLLAKEGCQYYQGFLCAEPLDMAALEAMVLARRK
ncbi:MAG: diguanylate cyclase [Sphingomonas sp. 28-66-16]|nr:MAG: diguanylate cyclase [Sphingomonas sp. 28-66-16]